MDARERYRETILFGRPDKIPFEAEGFGPTGDTLHAWHRQGLPPEVGHEDWRGYLLDLLGIKSEADRPQIELGVSTGMFPLFEAKIIGRSDGRLRIRDVGGFTIEVSDKYNLANVRSSSWDERALVTRRFISFPVERRDGWEALKWRFDPDAEGRFPPDFSARCAELRERNFPLSIKFHGPFWQLRDWLGLERLCIWLVEKPGLVEEMAYKHRSLISPQMARRFLKPAYDRWVREIKAAGCPIVDVDSDGYLGELIPMWLESGVNCCHPMEVAAGNDLPLLRRLFGARVAYRWGIDKRAVARGGRAMEEEVIRVAPLIEEGGYIPGIDHTVPPDVPWPAFVDYARLVAKVTGWL